MKSKENKNRFRVVKIECHRDFCLTFLLLNLTYDLQWPAEKFTCFI